MAFSPHCRYACNSKLADNPCHGLRTRQYAKHHLKLLLVNRPIEEEAPDILNDLLYTEMRREEDSEIYATATKLSIRLSRHLFDTLYHATALHIPEVVYHTADRRYFDNAKDLGRIALLDESDLT
jgi:hypothetical protein